MKQHILYPFLLLLGFIAYGRGFEALGIFWIVSATLIINDVILK